MAKITGPLFIQVPVPGPGTEQQCEYVEVVGLAEKIARYEQVLFDLVLDWAIQAEKLVTKVKKLSVFETRFREVRHTIDQTLAACTASVEDAAVIQAVKEFFEGGGDRDGLDFVVYAAFQHTEVPLPSDWSEQVARGRELYTRLAEGLELAQLEWDAVKDRFANLVADRDEVLGLCRGIREASRRLQEYRRQYESTALRPHNILDADNSPITEDHFMAAEVFAHDPDWAPQACEQRVVGLLDGIVLLLQQDVSLSRRTARLLETCEQTLERAAAVERRNRESSPPAPNHAALSPGEEIVTPVVATERLEQVYEIMLCLGLVLTCSKMQFSQITPKSALRKMLILGVVTEEECSSLIGPLQERVRQNAGEVETVIDKSTLSHRWESSSACWLSYRPKGSWWGLKLTQHWRKRARELLGRHNLSEVAIRAAQKKDQEQIKAAHRAHKEEVSPTTDDGEN